MGVPFAAIFEFWRREEQRATASAEDEEREGSLLGIDEVKRNTAMMRGDMAASRGRAAKEFAEADAAADGVYVSERAKKQAKAEARERSE